MRSYPEQSPSRQRADLPRDVGARRQSCILNLVFAKNCVAVRRRQLYRSSRSCNNEAASASSAMATRC